MEEFCEGLDENHDIYTLGGVYDFVEDDQLTPEEEGFMLGYIAS